MLTGVSTARDAVLAVPGERPSYLGADLRSLLEAHPEPVPTPAGGDAALPRPGSSTAAWSWTGAVGSLDLVRAACGAAWEAVDGGLLLDPASVPDLGVDGG